MNIKINVIPESKLSPLQLSHLQVAKEIARGLDVHPAHITNSVKIIGAYKLSGGPIYISPERLNKLRWTINTAIHEKAHHVSQANDGTRHHDDAISRLSAQVAQDASTGRFDDFLKEVQW